MEFGHRDLNADQMVFNKDKVYLFDTKEQKNFFVPFLSPFLFETEELMIAEKYHVNKNNYEEWKKKKSRSCIQC
jgi:hypothetical protein